MSSRGLEVREVCFNTATEEKYLSSAMSERLELQPTWLEWASALI
jgi:hypothetical protein